MTDYAVIPVEKVKVGTKLRADGGFTCIPEGAVLQVHKDACGDLFVPCNGPEDDPGLCFHYLDGQLDEDEQNYVGFWLVEDSQ